MWVRGSNARKTSEVLLLLKLVLSGKEKKKKEEKKKDVIFLNQEQLWLAHCFVHDVLQLACFSYDRNKHTHY